jgi:peptidoglycan hydrolase-like protein with peptidoglycan-binding domain
VAVCSFANQSRRYDSAFGGSYTGGPYKGILHTTEGSSLPGYGGGGSAPHFTVVPDLRTKTVRIYQHFNTSRPARALLNPAGGVQTNNDSAIQIELVGTCDPRNKGKGYGIYWPEAPKWALDGVAKLMRWIEANHGIPRRTTSRPWVAYPDSYGDSPARMGGHEWDTFAGWCGHQHVAENDHGDPGNLNITYLLTGPSKTTTVVKVGTTIAALAAALGLSITALLGANPSLPATPEATVTPGTTITIPAKPPVVVQPPSDHSPTSTSPSGSSYRVVTTPASKRPLLKQGVAGAAVKVVQNAVGVRADGLFGPGTKSAVRAYQARNGLVADGVVGPATWARILGAKSSGSSSAHPTLRYGAQGPAVARAQSLAGARADGDFGPATLRAIKAVQGRHGLVRDGIVGPLTWAALEQGAGAAARPVLREGSVSRHVRTVQQAVGAHVDGVFGPETERKVVAYQKRHGLVGDGVVGPRTWGAIL